MSRDRRFISLSLIALALCGAAIDVRGQRNEKPLSDLRDNPILLSVHTGVSVLADLIGPDPQDTDAVIVEVKGVRHSFKLDEVKIQPQARKFDEYSNVAFNDEKARLDNYVIELNYDPSASGYVIVYATCIGQGRTRAQRISEYARNSRGLDGGRLTTKYDVCKRNYSIELWIVPAGADPPRTSAGTLFRCPACKRKTQTRRSK